MNRKIYKWYRLAISSTLFGPDGFEYIVDENGDKLEFNKFADAKRWRDQKKRGCPGVMIFKETRQTVS